MGLPKIDVQAMTPQERLDLMSRIWESFTRAPDSLPITAKQAAELDRRMKMLDEGTMPTVPWEEIQARRSHKKPDAETADAAVVIPPTRFDRRLKQFVAACAVAWFLYCFWQAWEEASTVLLWVIGLCAAAWVVGAWMQWRTPASERAFVAESARARREWNELHEAAAACRRLGASVERLVRDRGCQVEGVVRWVGHDLEHETGERRPEMPSSGPAVPTVRTQHDGER